MKQQWLLLLAMVGMSLGASATYNPDAGYCDNCYAGKGSFSRYPITTYCTQQDFQTACNYVAPLKNSVTYPCGNSVLEISKNDCGDESSPDYTSEYNCYYCWKPPSDD